MTDVFFYLTQEQGQDALFSLVERMTKAAWQRRRGIYIHCNNQAQSQALDDWLWQATGSFLPHQQATDGAAPITLGWQDVPISCHDVLINLATEIPDFFSRFERVMEPVFGSSSARKTAREHWRFYQTRGYAVKKYDL